ncbi:MAG TPA: VWA domain-containing protein, partial [Pseudolabrys sp.]|nr:VWA domain-containing protein [Pseudolabrys sp.]
MKDRAQSQSTFTSPLAGEVGAQRREGGEHLTSARMSTPLPNPPPQGGREQAAASIGTAIRRKLAAFAHTLRDNGFKVGLSETGDALAILSLPVAKRPSSLKPALRALFCATHSDWERFDDIFDGYWLGHGQRQARVLAGTATAGTAPLRRIAEAGHHQGQHGQPDHSERRAGEDAVFAQGRGRREGATRAENIAKTDLRHITNPADIAETKALAERLARVMRARLVRREQARRQGRRLDLRRTIHRSVAHGGTPIDLAWRRR